MILEADSSAWIFFQLVKGEIPPTLDVFLDISFIIHIKIKIAVTIYWDIKY